MNKELKEELVFTALNIFGMVLIMMSVNVILTNGFNQSTFLIVAQQFIPMFIAAFVIEELIVSHNVKKLHKILVKPKDSRFKYIAVMTILMVVCMSVLMTIYITLIHVGTENNFWQHFLSTWSRNLPLALITQAFIVGPLTRIVHKNIFRKTELVD